MEKKELKSVLQDAVEQEFPASQIDLLLNVKERFLAGTNQKGEITNRVQTRRLLRLILATLAIAALLAMASTTTQGRALAQNLLQFFRRAESNSLPLQPWQIPAEQTGTSAPTAMPPAPLISVAKAELQSGFDAAELPIVPEGFEYLGARSYGTTISLEYNAREGGGALVILQSKEGFLQSNWDSVPAEAIVPVKIGEIDGEFAKGAFIVPAGETAAVWNPEAPILRLRWLKDELWFEMTKFGNVHAIEYLDRNGMIELGERLTHEPFPMAAEEAEAQTSFDVLEPVFLPDGMMFLGASFDPVLTKVSLQFGYSEEDARILIEQQPVGSGEACELCGMVGASASVESVQIGDVSGEYALGVWKLTEIGPIWTDDPYLKTIRWQKDGIAFELIFMGMELDREELIRVAASMQ